MNKKKILYLKKENGGPASARNLGIKESTGEYVAFLDADDIWLPNKLEEQTKLLKNHVQPVVVFSRRFYLPSNEKDPTQVYYGNIYGHLLKTNFITNSSVLIDKRIIKDVGLLNESPKLFAIEDYEYLLRIAKKYQFFYVDAPLVGYTIHDQQINKKTKKYKISRLLFKEFIDNFPSKYSILNFIFAFKMLFFELMK